MIRWLLLPSAARCWAASCIWRRSLSCRAPPPRTPIRGWRAAPPVNTRDRVAGADARNAAPMPFMDPAFASAVCRYDLSQGPLKLSVPVSLAYTSVSFYTRYDVAYYAINDRAAGRRVIELDLMTVDQHNQMPEDEEITAADRLIVESPTLTGLIAIRALAPEPGLDADGATRDRRRAMRACRSSRDR